MKSSKPLMLNTEYFVEYLNDLSAIITENADITKDDVTAVIKYINERKAFFESQPSNLMPAIELSHIEDSMHKRLLKLLSGHQDLTGLFTKINYEIERKREIISNRKATRMSISISSRIHDYIHNYKENKSEKIKTFLTTATNANLQGSISAYTDAIQLIPYSDFLYNKRGAAFFNNKQFDEAINDFTNAIELNPKNDSAYNNRGTALLAKNRSNEAINDFTKAIELNPKNDSACYNRGHFFLNKKQFDEAIDDFTKAIESNPNQAQYYRARGEASSQEARKLVKENKIEESRIALKNTINDFKKAIDLNPNTSRYINNYFSTWCSLATSYCHVEKFSEAIELYLQFITLDPNDTYLYYLKHSFGLSNQNCPDSSYPVNSYRNFLIGVVSLINSNDTDRIGKIEKLVNQILGDHHPENMYTAIIKIENEALRKKVLEFALDKKTPLGKWFEKNESFFSKISIKKKMENYYNELMTNPAHFERGRKFYTNNQLHEALADFNEALKSEPSFNSYYYRGRTYLKLGYSGFNRRAIEDFNKALELGDSNKEKAEVYYYRSIANHLVWREEIKVDVGKAAIDDCNNAIHLADEKEKVEYRRHRRKVYRDLCRYLLKSSREKSLEMHNEAIEKDQIAENYFYRAETYFSLQCYSHALIDCCAASQKEADDEKKLNENILVLLKEKLPINPEYTYKAIVRIDDENVRIKVLAYALNNKSPLSKWFGEKDGVFSSSGFKDRMLKYHATLTTPSQQTHFERGLNFYHNKQFEEAIADFNQVLKSDLSTSKPECYYYLGCAWFKNGFFDRAIQNFNEAIKLGHTTADTYYHRSMAYASHASTEKGSLQDWESSIEDCTKALKLDPKNNVYRSHLRKTHQEYVSSVCDEKALSAYYQKALEADPRAENYAYRAHAYFQIASRPKSYISRIENITNAFIDCCEAHDPEKNTYNREELDKDILDFLNKQLRINETKQTTPIPHQTANLVCSAIYAIKDEPLRVKVIRYALNKDTPLGKWLNENEEKLDSTCSAKLGVKKRLKNEHNKLIGPYHAVSQVGAAATIFYLARRGDKNHPLQNFPKELFQMITDFLTPNFNSSSIFNFFFKRPSERPFANKELMDKELIAIPEDPNLKEKIDAEESNANKPT